VEKRTSGVLSASLCILYLYIGSLVCACSRDTFHAVWFRRTRGRALSSAHARHYGTHGALPYKEHNRNGCCAFAFAACSVAGTVEVMDNVRRHLSVLLACASSSPAVKRCARQGSPCLRGTSAALPRALFRSAHRSRQNFIWFILCGRIQRVGMYCLYRGAAPATIRSIYVVGLEGWKERFNRHLRRTCRLFLRLLARSAQNRRKRRFRRRALQDDGW